MRRKTKLPELLAPAGDFESLYAAVEGGADAVYVGGKVFGARAFAKNFDIDELSRAVLYCHVHGVRLYVTVNTLVYDKELPELVDYALALWKMGVDALIISDLGAIRAIRRILPDFELHASTQMSIHSTDGAKAAANLGCTRVVLARELSFENIVSTTEASPIETEVFLHGALCVCHSGQCLFSSLVGGRSGNRGECAQPCRLPYGDKYLLSLNDLSLAKHIEALIDSGVASLKIEGRMKSPEYVYTATSIYRRLLDEHRPANEDEVGELLSSFSRGGFTDGYFTSRLLSKMTGIRSESDKSESRKKQSLSFTPKMRKITAAASIKQGEPARLTLTLGNRTVTVFGEIPSEAISAPLTKDAVKERIAKLGGTFLSLDTDDITLSLDEGLNLSPSALNALRRCAVEKLTSASREAPALANLPRNAKFQSKKLNTALFLKAELLTKVYKTATFAFDVIFLPLFDFKNASETANGIYLPPVVTDSERTHAREEIERAVSLGAKYALIGNLGHIELIKGTNLIPIGDFRLNIANTEAKIAFALLGIDCTLASAEMTLPMARDIGGGAIIYGRIPLMLTERCFMKENFGCRSCSDCSLTDRRGAKFPIIREYEHRNLILNSAVTYMADKSRELDAAKIMHRHAIFSVESEWEAIQAIDCIKRGAPLTADVTIRRMGKRDGKKPTQNGKKNAPVSKNLQKKPNPSRK